MIENPYNKVKHFHDVFHPSENHIPTAYSPEGAAFRSEFMVEELVEFLYAAADNDQQLFQKLTDDLKSGVDRAVAKIHKKQKTTEDVLVEEVDAVMDMLYFTYGTLVLMGVEPTKLFDIIHEANMGKMFPDGKAHFDPVTHKILKPADWEEHFAPEKKLAAEIKRQQQK